MTFQENRTNSKGSRRSNDPTRWCEVKLDGVVDSVPPDKGCEVLNEELTHECWDENDSENFADSVIPTFLLKWGVQMALLTSKHKSVKKMLPSFQVHCNLLGSFFMIIFTLIPTYYYHMYCCFAYLRTLTPFYP